MKGLLLKDFYSILGLKNIIYVFFMAVVFSSFTEGSSFISAYIPIMAMMMAISTFSYDEYYKWDSYALTMPLNRKLIVLEKYLFVILVLLGSIVVSMGASVLIETFHGGVDFVSSFFASIVTGGMFLFLFSILIPVFIKIGAEKGRYVIMIICLGIFGLGMGLSQLVSLSSGIEWLESNGTLLALIFPILLVFALWLSMKISYRIYCQKEF